MNFYFDSADGTQTCWLAFSHLWSDVYAVDQRGSGQCNAQEWAELFRRALRQASAKGASSVIFRMTENSSSKELAELMPHLGFEFKEGRKEFRAFVSDLPSDEGTPFVWRSAKELDWDAACIARALALTNAGALDTEPNENPLSYIGDWLADSSLLSGPECVSIGFVQSKFAGLLVAQTNPRTLWSRISYMGLAPEFRGQGLGKWVHRRGFVMLKQQGADLYHGGTNSRNFPMIRLFETHGCRPYLSMQEWRWNPRAALANEVDV